jgi:hypothetical protein
MDDLSRAWAILGIPPGSSAEAIKSAYREQVKAWHPDRFQSNPDQLEEAHEMLKEINWAYDLISARIEDVAASTLPAVSAPTPPTPPEDPPVAAEPTDLGPGATRGKWIGLAAACVLILGVLGFFLHRSADTTLPARPPISTSSQSGAPTTKIEETNAPPTVDHGILRKMLADEKLRISDSPEGLVLKGGDMRDCLRTPFLLRPPFTFRATIKSDNADVRFYFGLGLAILNWSDNPTELRFHDFATGSAVAMKGKGSLTSSEWHDLVFDVRTNFMSISVDGETRYEANGFYQNLLSAPGIAPFKSEMTVKSVVVDGSPVDHQPRARTLVPGDLVATMTPMDGVIARPTVEGIVLYDGENKAGYLQTTETFHAPIVIRTRVKIDGIDLRLYFGAGGRIIFNWEGNPTELRIHDPTSGAGGGIPRIGMLLPNEWHDIVWEIQTSGMRLFLDGQLRYQNRANYSKAQGPAGIGPYLSHATVASFVVEQK